MLLANPTNSFGGKIWVDLGMAAVAKNLAFLLVLVTVHCYWELHSLKDDVGVVLAIEFEDSQHLGLARLC